MDPVYFCANNEAIFISHEIVFHIKLHFVTGKVRFVLFLINSKKL